MVDLIFPPVELQTISSSSTSSLLVLVNEGGEDDDTEDEASWYIAEEKDVGDVTRSVAGTSSGIVENNIGDDKTSIRNEEIHINSDPIPHSLSSLRASSSSSLHQRFLVPSASGVHPTKKRNNMDRESSTLTAKKIFKRASTTRARAPPDVCSKTDLVTSNARLSIFPIPSSSTIAAITGSATSKSSTNSTCTFIMSSVTHRRKRRMLEIPSGDTSNSHEIVDAMSCYAYETHGNSQPTSSSSSSSSPSSSTYSTTSSSSSRRRKVPKRTTSVVSSSSSTSVVGLSLFPQRQVQMPLHQEQQIQPTLSTTVPPAEQDVCGEIAATGKSFTIQPPVPVPPSPKPPAVRTRRAMQQHRQQKQEHHEDFKQQEAVVCNHGSGSLPPLPKATSIQLPHPRPKPLYPVVSTTLDATTAQTVTATVDTLQTAMDDAAKAAEPVKKKNESEIHRGRRRSPRFRDAVSVGSGAELREKDLEVKGKRTGVNGAKVDLEFEVPAAGRIQSKHKHKQKTQKKKDKNVDEETVERAGKVGVMTRARSKSRSKFDVNASTQ
ncbi:hypothetical protein HK102_001538 [Quaeritorhiza haematococci]|nr:hypothetical protein HK102_001538 [Quaeritorhiza haematococci]